MTAQRPIVSADEIFAVNTKIRWVALASNRGDVLLNQMRPNVKSLTPAQADRDFVALGPLTIMGVCEKYSSEYLKGVEYVVVWYNLSVHVYARLGEQILAVSIEKDRQAIMAFEQWLEAKQRGIDSSKQER